VNLLLDVQRGRESASATSSGSWNTDPVPSSITAELEGLAAKGFTAPLPRKNHPKQVASSTVTLQEASKFGRLAVKCKNHEWIWVCCRAKRRQTFICCRQFGVAMLGKLSASLPTYGQLLSAI